MSRRRPPVLIREAVIALAPRAALPHERFCLLASEIHHLGPRPLCELFAELDRGAELYATLERYAGIKPFADFIRAHGGDRITPARLAASRGVRRP